MAASFDMIIRNGRLYDGTGAEPFVADIAISGGRIAAIAPNLAGDAAEEIDATGRIVTPGFIDGHTHYDGQIVWDSALEPSASHGVTTVVTGNCGVGFAPVRAPDRDRLIAMMEDVEDIPGTALHEGIDWQWESFPEYLDILSRRGYAADVAVQLPHAPLRLYVMGDRGANDELATADDIAAMAALVREALEAGAVGFSTSRVLEHRWRTGRQIPGTFAAEDELLALAGAVRDAGRGLLQAVPRGSVGGTIIAESAHSLEAEMELLARVALSAKVPLLYSLMQPDDEPDAWRTALDITDRVNREGGAMRAMVGPRSPGNLSSWAGRHVFTHRPTWLRIAALPRDRQLEELRRPEVKAAILGEADVPPDGDGLMSSYHLYLRHTLGGQFAFDSGNVFEPDPASDSLQRLADKAGQSLESYAYDVMLRDAGRAQISFHVMNYAAGNYDAVAEMLAHPATVIGLSDAGAHVGIICDAANPTFTLAFWGRDRTRGPKLDLAGLIRMHSADLADLFGFADRGCLKPGLRADINVIDFDRIGLTLPHIAADLPLGGKRLLQGATGYAATLVAGVVTRRDDADTGARPGRLVRNAGLR